MFNANLCSATGQHGTECMAQAVEGAPIALCMKHIMQVGSFWNDVRPKRRDSKVDFSQADVGRKEVGYEQVETSVVYYIIHGSRIKIGTSKNWRERLKNLPCDRVLALEPGGSPVEGDRHRQFNTTRFHGSEWFAESDELWDHIVSVSEANPELTAKAERFNKERAAISRARRIDGVRNTGYSNLPSRKIA